jgi:hypothetical protein
VTEIASIKTLVRNQLEEAQWRGFDPFDGLNTPYLQPLVSGAMARLPGVALLRLVILQAVKRSPWNFRRLIGVRAQENAMSWAVGALGASAANAGGAPDGSEWIARALEKMHSLRGESTKLWGYPFPWQARAFYLKAGEPNLVISAVCLRALAEGIRTFAKKDPDYAELLRKRYSESLAALLESFYKPEGFFSYVSNKAVLVHNANLLAIEGVFAAKRYGITIPTGAAPMAAAALAKTLSHQDPNGRWSYGTEKHHAWCDNFHTAYNLVSLARIHAMSGEQLHRDVCAEAIRRGLPYYLRHAFTREGDARYFDHHTWPLETHSAAAALVCLGELSREQWLPIEEARNLSHIIVEALDRTLHLGSGSFAYRRWPHWMNRTVFTRWTQAWLYYGLEHAASLARHQPAR